MGLGFAAFGAELPELEARCHEHLYYAQPSVLAATEDPQGTRVLNLFARDCLKGDLRRSKLKLLKEPLLPAAAA